MARARITAVLFTCLASAPVVLLMHGSADQLLPARHTIELARVLRGAGTGVTVHMLAGADHDTVYAPHVAGPPVLRWLSHEWWR